MIDELNKTAKQVGIEIIEMSKVLSEEMQTWSDVLAQNPESITATMSAGFITKFNSTSGRELTVDVQTPSNATTVLRTWVIETITGDDGNEYFNNIQLTFGTDDQNARDLIAKSGNITREDILLALQSETTKLERVTVSHESGGDGTKQTHGKRFDLTITELGQQLDNAKQVDHTLQQVMHALKESMENTQK